MVALRYRICRMTEARILFGDTPPHIPATAWLQIRIPCGGRILRTHSGVLHAAAVGDELAEQYLQIDPHSPAEFRTNGIASNVDLFYDAFNVTEGDAMWLDPDARVRIW